MKRVQDAVHGLMEFRGVEATAIEALSTPELQRLRQIKHLGLVYLVFPAAEHSRFAHSLGACHLMSRFVASLRAQTAGYLPDALQPDESTTRDLVLAGLLHDAGHGPLSHAWEHNVIGRDLTPWRVSLELPDEPWIPSITKWHELVTQGFLLGDTALHEKLDAVDAGLAGRVASLLGRRYYLPYLTGLLSSDIDVDRCDFILRDAYQTGVAHGRLDLDWLVSTITVGAKPNGDPVIGFDEAKAPRVVEQLLIARRALYDNVYQHRVVKSAEGMVGLLLRRVKKCVEDDEHFLGAIEGFGAYKKALTGAGLKASEVLQLDDAGLWVFIRRLAEDAADETVRELASQLASRDLFKAVPIDDLTLDRRFDEERDAPEAIERALENAGISDPADHWLLDRVEFDFFHRGEGEGSWFVDTRGSGRQARPITQYDDLRRHAADSPRVRRTLYVPRIAVDQVARALRA